MHMKTNRYRTVVIVSALVAALGGGVSCGGDGTTDPPPPPPPPPPVAPVAVGSIPAQVVTAGQSATVDVLPFFRDPDGGTLTYAAASSAEAVLTVSLTGSNLSIAAVARGTATVTVTATDPDGLTATQSAGVTVEAANQAPEAVGTIPAQAMTVGQTATVNVASFFSDPDGDALGYSAATSAPGVVSVAMSGSVLTMVGVADGTATVTVTARDPDGLTAAQSVAVTVQTPNRAPEAVGTIPPQSVSPGQSRTVDVSSYFRDPDGDVLTYAVTTSNALANASVSGSRVTVIGVAEGTATVTVTARDPGGLTATQRVSVSVPGSLASSGGIGAGIRKGDSEHTPLESGHAVAHGHARLDHFGVDGVDPLTRSVDAGAQATLGFADLGAQLRAQPLDVPFQLAAKFFLYALELTREPVGFFRELPDPAEGEAAHRHAHAEDRHQDAQDSDHVQSHRRHAFRTRFEGDARHARYRPSAPNLAAVINVVSTANGLKCLDCLLAA